MSDELEDGDLAELAGLPPAAVERVRHQRSSGVRGSLLSAPAAAAVRSAGLEPVGEVFGCIVVAFGWSGGSCGYGYGWNTTYGGGGPVGGWGRTSGGIPGTSGGGIAGGTSANAGPAFRTAAFGGNRPGGVAGY